MKKLFDRNAIAANLASFQTQAAEAWAKGTVRPVAKPEISGGNRKISKFGSQSGVSCMVPMHTLLIGASKAEESNVGSSLAVSHEEGHALFVTYLVTPPLMKQTAFCFDGL